MKAVVLHTYGEPSAALEFGEIPGPEKPGPGQVLVAVEYAPINFSDILVARGLYALRPELPSVIGNEGAGQVLEIGEGVTNVRVGDRVVLPMGGFVWRERLIAREQDLVAVPQAIDPRQAAMLRINPPSAYLLINAYVDLKAGDWIALSERMRHLLRKPNDRIFVPSSRVCRLTPSCTAPIEIARLIRQTRRICVFEEARVCAS